MGTLTTQANVGAAGRGGVLGRGNVNMAAQATTADGDLAVSTTVAVTPRSDSLVYVDVNGVAVNVADGDANKAVSEAFFSGDGGTTGRFIKDVTAGDELYWNGSIAGYELAGTDRVTFLYDV